MPTTLFGIILGLGIMIYAIIGVSKNDPDEQKTLVTMYIDIPAFLLVAGGTLASTLIAHPLSHLLRGFKAFFTIFIRSEFNWIKTIEDIADFSSTYAQKGIPGLEEKLNTYKDENMLREGVRMIVNGYKKQEVREFLETAAQRRYDREMIDFYIFRTMARMAPAFGMVGTLVGLIYMLRILGDSPDKIGPFLAMALVATFYGLVFANLIFNPMGNKLMHHAEIHLRVGLMEIEGVMYIFDKQHPVYIKDQLAGYIPPNQMKKLFKEKK